jgi:2-iminobutanoate/2-iminopropanoate deaminase
MRNSDVFQTLGSAGVLPPDLPFAGAVRHGDTLYLSGQIGNRPGTLELVPGGLREEARQAIGNIATILAAHGAELRDVIRCTVMLADMNEWAVFNEVWKDVWPHPFPARSAFGCQGLALGARVEIECTAACRVAR